MEKDDVEPKRKSENNPNVVWVDRQTKSMWSTHDLVKLQISENPDLDLFRRTHILFLITIISTTKSSHHTVDKEAAVRRCRPTLETDPLPHMQLLQ